MSVDEFRRKLRQLKAVTQKTIETTGKPDAEQALRLLAEMRKLIPEHVGSPRPAEEVRTRSTGGMEVGTEEDFEWAVVIDGMEAVLRDVEDFVDQKKAALMEKLLQVYHVTEEASHDPANAHLIEHVERMRTAYEEAYGRPIPPPKDGSSEDGV